MASSWRDLLPKVLADREAQAVSSVRAVSSDDGEESGPNGPNGANGTPAAIIAGVQRLSVMRCPAGADEAIWRRVNEDAARLGNKGWAAKASALGWSAMDLFGAVPTRDGDPAGDGLAVWLGGRRILALCDTYAVVEDACGGRSYFNRRQAECAVLLWDMGKARC